MANEFHRDSTDAVLSRVETVLERVEKRLDQGDAKFDAQDKRIQKLEGWRFYTIGLAAGVALAAKYVWDWVVFGFNGPKH